MLLLNYRICCGFCYNRAFGKAILSSHAGFCDNRQRQGPDVDIIKLKERPGNQTEKLTKRYLLNCELCVADSITPSYQ